MPIYAYRCATCGHAQDVLQKMSDPLLTTCPACGAETYSKQVTAAGFQLKGSGWYVTDFRGGKKAEGEAKGGDKPEGKADAKPERPEKSEASGGKGDAAAGPKSETGSKLVSDNKAAPSPPTSSSTPAPSPAPKSPPPAAKS